MVSSLGSPSADSRCSLSVLCRFDTTSTSGVGAGASSASEKNVSAKLGARLAQQSDSQREVRSHSYLVVVELVRTLCNKFVFLVF